MSSVVALRRWLPAVVGLLLVASAALVTVGVTIERSVDSNADTGAAESAEHTYQPGSTENETAEGEHTESSEESPDDEAALGVPIESPVVLAGQAMVAVGLALLVCWRPTRLAAGAVIAFTVAAGVVDVLEIGRQVTADRVGLAALAGLIALPRMGTVAGAAVAWRAGPALAKATDR